MENANDPGTEQERIRSVYSDWLRPGRTNLYAWHRPDIMQQADTRRRLAGNMLADAFGSDLSKLRAVDVGCGSGAYLRQLIDWGADPARLTGTEYQEARLAQARERTAAGVHWHLGDLDVVPDGSVDLISANTVFSSILNPLVRTALAADMWRALAPGGWVQLFDFRYNNPNNVHVRRVGRTELLQWWTATQCRYQTLLLAPPISRALAHAPRLLVETLEAVAPPLRSHFIYMAQKPQRSKPQGR